VNESTIAAFLLGKAEADTLAAELESSAERLDAISQQISVKDMATDFLITRDMGIRICDSVLCGKLESAAVRLLAFVILTSDRLTWGDDDLLGEVLYDWSCPEVNYPLSLENMNLFRSWLDGNSAYPAKTIPASELLGKTLSRLVRKQL
jgi:hypothetical protein